MRRLLTVAGAVAEPTRERLQSCFARKEAEGFWLDIEAPTDEDYSLLQEVFGFHPLSIEDIQGPNERPKLDEYQDYLFLVLFSADLQGDEVAFREDHLYHSKTYCVTVHHQPTPELGRLYDRIRESPELAKGDSSFLTYLVIDALVDGMFPVLDSLDETIDDLQDSIIENADPPMLSRITKLKHSVSELRRQLGAQRDVFQRLVTHSLNWQAQEITLYYRDVYDHIIRQYETADSLRDLLAGAMDVYLSTVSNRLNATMKQLTVIASLFLPLTFLTGFFGMNFGLLVTHIVSTTAFMIGLAVMTASIVVQLAVFRVRGWI